MSLIRSHRGYTKVFILVHSSVLPATLLSISLLADHPDGNAQDVDEYVASDSSIVTEEYFPSGSNPVEDLRIGVGVGTGLARVGKFLGMQEASVTVGGFFDGFRGLQVTATYTHAPFAHTTDPEYPIADGVGIVGVQADLRFYTPERYFFLDQYFSAGAGVMAGFWKYDQALFSARLATFSTDYLLGYDIHVGMGFVVGQSWPLSVTLDLTPGVVFWSKGVDEEYSRASLPTTPYMKFRVQISYLIQGE